MTKRTTNQTHAVGEAMDASGTPPLSPHPHPELVFGLVGPVGVDLEPVITVLSRGLNAMNYRVKAIQLSKRIEAFFSSDHSKEPENQRILRLMKEGTRLRVKSGKGDAVALLGIAEIKRLREEELGGSFEKTRSFFVHSSIRRRLRH